ncbi:MAG: indolepyruvate ferredoxin oxidoreductase subunit alpha [Archaeoglobus sp.]|nr:indolepyruvate ferredoxin oxidoreductase subunit alpha [Archaeoglobus sp.]
MIKDVVKDAVGEKVFFLGNEAIARGAIEAGIDIYATYPGTPSSEISDTLSEVCRLLDKMEFYMEYSTNEKVAFEVAAAASMIGKRGMCAMKHVGVNVAADALFSFAYMGAKGGFVVVSADDPTLHSSQNEQDNRWYGEAAKIPVIEPSTVPEAKELVKEAFRVSEEFNVPVMYRTCTRLNHASAIVELGEIPEKKLEKVDWERDPFTNVLVPAIARQRKLLLLERLAKVKDAFNNFSFNKVIDGNRKEGVIACGLDYVYVVEALERLNANLPVFKLSTQYPLPEKALGDFLSNLDKVAIVEEVDPFVELHIRALAKEYGIEVYGKQNGYFPDSYELNIPIVEKGIAKMLGMQPTVNYDEAVQKASEIQKIAPPRPPVFCPGCPHAASFYVIRKVSDEYGKAALPSDIGCYTLGVNKPFEAVDICLCMGGGMGISNGLSKLVRNKVIITVGDSTFFHAAIPALIDAVHNEADLTLVVLDNSTTAMTGHQPHPGIVQRGCGLEARAVSIEELAKGLGIEFVEVVRPYNIKKMEETLKRAIEHPGVAVIVAKQLCAILWNRQRKSKGIEIRPFEVLDNCNLCLECVSSFACPAIIYDGKKVWIDASQCAGCGVCARVCPEDAIKPKKKGG